MTKRTNIEQLMDLSEIFDGKGQPSSNSQTQQSYNGMQSMDGFPVPPYMDSNYGSQMSREIADREKQKSSFQGKIRQSSDYRTAMNGGSSIYDKFYPMVSYHNNQQANYKPAKIEVEEVEYKKYMDSDDESEYELGPRARKQKDHMHMNMNMHHMNNSHISCIDIARHVKSCPICSKLYENDKSIYIIGIVFLLVVCIILLKKVLESGDK